MAGSFKPHLNSVLNKSRNWMVHLILIQLRSRLRGRHHLGTAVAFVIRVALVEGFLSIENWRAGRKHDVDSWVRDQVGQAPSSPRGTVKEEII